MTAPIPQSQRRPTIGRRIFAQGKYDTNQLLSPFTLATMMQAQRNGTMLPTVSDDEEECQSATKKRRYRSYQAAAKPPAGFCEKAIAKAKMATKTATTTSTPSAVREDFFFSSRPAPRQRRQTMSSTTRRASREVSPEIPSPPPIRRLVSIGSTFFRFRSPPRSSPAQGFNLSRQTLPIPPSPFEMYVNFQYDVVGDPSLKILRLRLPPHLLDLIDKIVLGCEAHAASLPSGWLTGLYSLTKQDIALAESPALYQMAKPIVDYLKHAIAVLYGAKSIRMDRNQPHVLKYSIEDGHIGVQLHHDKCDISANLCLSRSSSYVGGGTFFPALGYAVRLEFGEFLLHPGGLVHGGLNILSGTRHLMVIFAHVQ